LKHLDAIGSRDARLQLVINRHHQGGGLGPAQIADRFGLPLLATLACCERLRTSANHGHLLLQDAPRAPYLRALAPLLARLCPAALPARPHTPLETLMRFLDSRQWKRK